MVVKKKNKKINVVSINPAQKNAQLAAILSAIVVIGNYFLWIKSLLDVFGVGFWLRVFYFIFTFFVCLGFAILLFNINTAEIKLADKR
jgi:hypothetical protein